MPAIMLLIFHLLKSFIIYYCSPLFVNGKQHQDHRLSASEKKQKLMLLKLKMKKECDTMLSESDKLIFTE